MPGFPPRTATERGCSGAPPAYLERSAANKYPLRRVRGTEARNLQNPRDAAISADFIARTGEICMIMMTSQIAPSRPMLMLDACLAL
jgi:hypothetical protein